MGYEVHIYCDECEWGYTYAPNRPVSITAAKKLVRELGWTVGKQWLCPTCKKKWRKNNGRS